MAFPRAEHSPRRQRPPREEPSQECRYALCFARREWNIVPLQVRVDLYVVLHDECSADGRERDPNAAVRVAVVVRGDAVEREAADWLHCDGTVLEQSEQRAFRHSRKEIGELTSSRIFIS